MDIDEEIKARIAAAKTWDKDAKIENFQIKAAANGYVLINLKTRRAQLISAETDDPASYVSSLPFLYSISVKIRSS